MDTDLGTRAQGVRRRRGHENLPEIHTYSSNIKPCSELRRRGVDFEPCEKCCKNRQGCNHLELLRQELIRCGEFRADDAPPGVEDGVRGTLRRSRRSKEAQEVQEALALGKAISRYNRRFAWRVPQPRVS